VRYQAFFIDDDENVQSVLNLHASDAADALRKAEALLSNQPIEVWEVSAMRNFDRLLKRIEPFSMTSRTGFWRPARGGSPGSSGSNFILADDLDPGLEIGAPRTGGGACGFNSRR
jgi:hypothetical protein